jgi:hypothetical protein
MSPGWLVSGSISDGSSPGRCVIFSLRCSDTCGSSIWHIRGPHWCCKGWPNTHDSSAILIASAASTFSLRPLSPNLLGQRSFLYFGGCCSTLSRLPGRWERGLNTTLPGASSRRHLPTTSGGRCSSSQPTYNGTGTTLWLDPLSCHLIIVLLPLSALYRVGN